ncbi:MAG: hypothetical protein ABSE15_09820 [Candidatus Bathyarchaeia archaeon]
MVKNFGLVKRIDTLSKKINDPNPEEIIHIDFKSFSDAERTLFQKVDEIEEEWRKTGDEEILIKNAELLLKPSEVIFRRITDLYCYVATTLLAGGQNKEIVDYFFKLHFYNFETDLSECLSHFRTWTDKDKEEFLSDLKENGAHMFRIPRGYNEDNCKDIGALKDSKDLDEKSDQNLREEGG